MFKPKTILCTVVLFVSSCSPLHYSYLRFFSGFLSSPSGSVSIERGDKKRHFEFGGSFFARNRNDTTILSKKSYYQSSEDATESKTIDFTTVSPKLWGTLYGEYFYKSGFCARFEGQYAEIAAERLLSVSTAVGVRYLEGPVYFRFFLTTGLTNVIGKAQRIEFDHSGKITIINYNYTTRNPFIGYSITANTHFSWPVNPFCSLHGQNIYVFKTTLNKINLPTLTTVAGIYKVYDPITVTAGIRLDHYVKDRSINLHPSLMLQGTIAIGAATGK